MSARSLNNTLGEPIASTVYPHGPSWEGKISPYSPAYNTPDSPGRHPPPNASGTLRASTRFPTAPPPLPLEPFGEAFELTFELRGHSVRRQPSGKHVSLAVGNSTPLGRVLDHAMYKAHQAGVLQGYSNRILGVFGPSGKQLQTGSGLTLYDQSPRIPPGSTIVLVFQD